MYERDPAIAARFQGYRLMLNPHGYEALRGCLPRRLHPLLDAVVGDASAAGLVLDPQLNQIGELGPARTGIVVDRDVLRHLLLTGLTVHTGAALTGYDVARSTAASRPGSRTGTTPPPTCSSARTASAPPSARRSHRTIVPTDTGVRFVIGRTPLTEQFAGLSRAFGSKITGDGSSLLLGRDAVPHPTPAGRRGTGAGGDPARHRRLRPLGHDPSARTARSA